MIAENKAEGKLLSDEQKLELGTQYLDDVPEVNARFQKGYKAPNTGKDRARINEHHENRREDSIGEIIS